MKKLTGKKTSKRGTVPIRSIRTKQPTTKKLPVSLSSANKQFIRGIKSYKEKVRKTIIGISKTVKSEKQLKELVGLQLARKENVLKRSGFKGKGKNKVKVWTNIKTGKKISGKRVQTIVRKSIEAKMIKHLMTTKKIKKGKPVFLKKQLTFKQASDKVKKAVKRKKLMKLINQFYYG